MTLLRFGMGDTAFANLSACPELSSLGRFVDKDKRCNEVSLQSEQETVPHQHWDTICIHVLAAYRLSDLRESHFSRMFEKVQGQI